MNSAPKITVIIPVYKVEPYLRQCLDSVVNQTYHNLEIIVIDDGSPDNCGKICDEYAQKDDRITVIHKENEGLSAGWNDGIAASSGEWIAFVDSDDWIDDTYFEKLISGISKAENIDMVISGGHYEEIGTKTIERAAIHETYILDMESNRENLQLKVFVATDKKQPSDRITCVWNKLYNTSFLKEGKLSFDTQLCAGLGNDILFNYMVLDKAHAVCRINKAGYHYRVLNTAGTRKFDPYRSESTHDFLVKFDQILKKTNASPIMREAFKTYSLQLIITNLQLCFFSENNEEEYLVVAKKIKKMKKMPHYHAAIYSKNNKFMTPKQKIMKFFLHLPWVWPLKLLYDLNEKVKKVG